MKPTHTIEPGLVDNRARFTDAFFDRFTLRPAPKPLQLTGTIAKDYLFPTLYDDVTCAIGIFMCDYGAARRLMPHPRVVPVRMTRGRSLVVFSCYQYRNVLGVAPYNEIAMTIPVMVDPPANVPVLPMVADIFKEFGYHVFSMPVTSLENQLRGVKIWGLPKVVQEIDQLEERGDAVTVAKEATGETYFELRVPMNGVATEFDVSSNLYSRLGDDILQSRTSFKGTFAVTKHMRRLVAKGGASDRPYLTLGNSPSGLALQQLGIEAQPFQLRYARRMTSAFDLPSAEYKLAPRRRPSLEAARRSIKKRLVRERPELLFFGAGVIGGSVAGWLAGAEYDRVTLFDRPEVAAALSQKGITLYAQGHEGERETVKPRAVSSLKDAPAPDVILVGVKNYSLDGAAQAIRERFGDRPTIVAMQNGVENQKVLPKYFSKVIYCIVSYNAWADEPGVIGFQKRGPLVLGALTGGMNDEVRRVARVLDLGVPTVVTGRVRDAAYCKLVINLSNSLTTLIGHGFQPVSDAALFQKLLTTMTWEGVKTLRAAGIREVKLGGMPSWLTIAAAANLPPRATRGLFEKNVKKMVRSSMAQDVIQRGGAQSELDTLNGAILALADQHNVRVPVNRAVYELCKREFARPRFAPLDVRDVWAAVEN